MKLVKRIFRNGGWEDVALDYPTSGFAWCEGHIDENGEEQGYWKYYEGDNLREKIGFKDGVEHGQYIFYHSNGKVESVTNYENGAIQGTVIGHYDNGEVMFEWNYVDGNRVGVQRWYYPNGKIKVEENVINGRRDGLYREWDKEGNLTEMYTRNGKEISKEEWEKLEGGKA